MYRSARVTLDFRTDTGSLRFEIENVGKGPDDFDRIGEHIGAGIQKSLNESLLKPAAANLAQMQELRNKLSTAEKQLEAYTITAAPATAAARDNAPDPSSSVPGVQVSTRKTRRGSDRE